MKEFKIALAGNPNAGKSSVFNGLTGARQHVANYPGVTVEKKEGEYEYKGVKFKVIDLPGIYSLTAYSIEEIVARNFIIEEKPDVVIDVIDASNIERNLYLAIQLMELNVPLILVLNMMDEAKKKGLDIDSEYLSKLLNVPIVETIANKEKGIDKLKEEIYNFCLNKREISLPKLYYGDEIEESISNIETLLKKECQIITKYNPKWLAIKLLENDNEIKKELLKIFPENHILWKVVDEEIERLRSIFNEEPDILIAERRYGFISGACRESIKKSTPPRLDISDKIDAVLTNKFVGIPIFLILMYITFQLTFTLGQAPMDLLDTLFTNLSLYISKAWPSQSLIKSLIVDGIIPGVGSVIVFLPNIILLFFAIGILESTGYMARAAFIIDKIMHKIGLHGKSFIPMLVGFGCNVPGIMATRTLDTEKDRILTILVLPLMSCGARVPIYMLIIPAFFPKKFQAPIMWLIYMTGIVLAMILVKILNKVIFKGMPAPFLMELPPYRIPTFKNLYLYIREKSYQYIKKAGTIILALSIILWFLSTFPQTTQFSKDYDKIKTQIKSKYTVEINQIENEIKNNKDYKLINDLIKSGKNEEAKLINNKIYMKVLKLNYLKDKMIKEIDKIEAEKHAEIVANTFIGRIGHFFEPAFKPVGFDWKIVTAIIASLPAKEVFVSQMSIINAVGERESTKKLITKLRERYTPLVGICILLWVLVASPCIATLAVTKQETGSWKWVFVQFFGLTGLAYIIVFLVYNIGNIFIS